MKADTLTLKALFQRDVRYVIPTFQRPYVWNQDEQWEPLWDDVRNTAERYLEALASAQNNHALAEERTPTHFLGAVVLQQQPTAAAQLEVRNVIDGQQRLTTTQLLLDAAQEALVDLGAESEGNRLSRLVQNSYAVGDDVFKLWPTSLDRDAFRAAMTNALSPVGFENSLIVQAHDFFRLQVREWVMAAGSDLERAERIHGLETALFGLLELVVIDLSTADDAFVIFETLNARGTPLLASDLIKNYVLQTASASGLSAEDVYQTEWKQLEDPWWRSEVGQGRITRPRLDVLLNYWLILRSTEEVPPPQLFPSFKSYVEGHHHSVVEVATDIRRVAAVYRSFDTVDEFSDLGTFFYRWNVVDAGVTTPVLLWLLAQPQSVLPDDQRMLCLHSIESFLVRRMICRMTTKDYNRLFLELLKRLDKAAPAEIASTLVTFLHTQKAESRSWPTDHELQAALVDLPLYRLLTRGRLRMVLEAIEDTLRSPLAEESHCPRGTLTIEHIMPQAWQQHWPAPDTDNDLHAEFDRERLMHSLGNLTLVNGRLNPTLSNDSWTVKRSTLGQHTVLHLNKRLLHDFGTVGWTDGAIRERGLMLAAEVVKIWPAGQNVMTLAGT